MLKRFSSRQQPLGKHFLQERLQEALHYDRIAGYFSSSMLEIAGEQIQQMNGRVRMICNSDLDPMDLNTAKAAAMAMTLEWKKFIDTHYSESLQQRLQMLYDLLASKRLEIKVLPNFAFGLIHGKAGVITQQDGSKTAFLGSANASKSAWQLNYELLWEDDSVDTVNWVQTEFDSLWHDFRAKPLAETILKDVKRFSKRNIVTHEAWKKQQAPAAAAVVESPIYRRFNGLWSHQKYFIKLAYEEHISGRGARYVLADQVGLGKTVQLAMAAMLMALQGGLPVLVIAPKTLIHQWQDELMKLLHLPSAVWDGKAWIDENGIRYANDDPEKALLQCPRRFGIISQGLIVRDGSYIDRLKEKQYECVIVDEAHRSRRKNLKEDTSDEPAEPNNMMRFLLQLSKRTKSMLLGTATPVQLYKIEAYDLLQVLAAGSPHILGSSFSQWRKANKTIAFRLVEGTAFIREDMAKKWEWVRDPFPPAAENAQLFGTIRRSLSIPPTEAILSAKQLTQIKPWNKKRIEDDDAFFKKHNPYIRFIVRRTRNWLENTIDPTTNEPYLQKVSVELLGENETIPLPSYLEDAYQTATEFCQALGEIMKGAGFIKTLLLRRIGSSMMAGKKTAIKMLGEQYLIEEEDEEMEMTDTNSSIARRLGKREQDLLTKLIYELEQYQADDPKLDKLHDLLFDKQWAARGCIIFSQYFDTVQYFAEKVAAKTKLDVGVYAGANKSGIWRNGHFQRMSKDKLKELVQIGELKIIFGTDSASEGLNLQRLGTLINLDLPWNPTRLEQRKGRIQRIGQKQEKVLVYNMRYAESVEARVHELLSARLSNLYDLFGQIPDVLQDVWVEVALGEIEEAKERIRAIDKRSPFELRYDKIEPIDFETYTEVLNPVEIQDILSKAW